MPRRKIKAQVPGAEQNRPGRNQMGLLQWRAGKPSGIQMGRTMTLLTELRYTDPKGKRLDRSDRIACRWGVHPALPMVDHGAGPLRRKISECLGVARCVVWGQETAVAGLRPHVLTTPCVCSGVSAVEAKTMFYRRSTDSGITGNFQSNARKPVKFDGQLVARAEPIPRAIPVNPTLKLTRQRDWIQNDDPES